MTRIGSYLFRQLVVWSLSITVCLTCVVWLTQSLKFVEMIVNRGLSVAIFAYFTALLLPTFLTIILPVALFAAILFTYVKLAADSELIVIRSIGVSQLSLAKPALLLAVVFTALGYLINLYLLPAAYREFKTLKIEIKNSYSSVLLQEGVFNSILSGVTVFVRDRDQNGELLGIIIHDSRSETKPVTLMAERGFIVSGQTGPRVIMENGNRQEVDPETGRMSLLHFNRYSFEIGWLAEAPEDRWISTRERFLDELFWPEAEIVDESTIRKLWIEGHDRLASPLLSLALALVGLASILSGDYNRRGQGRRLAFAILCVISMEAAMMGIKALGQSSTAIAPALYILPMVAIVLFLVMLSGWTVHRRRGVPYPAAQEAT